MNLVRICLIGTLLCLFCVSTRGGEIDSGLQTGEQAVSFDVKDCTGPAAGKTLCYFCRYGHRPVVAIFVNELSPQVESLIKAVDRAAEAHRSQRVAALVVYLGDDTPEVEDQLRALSRAAELRHTPLTLVRESKAQLREKYQLSKEAAVTMLMWRELRVRDRIAFDTAKIPADVIESLNQRVKSLLE